MNTIDERCYGYEPATAQLGALRQEVATAWAENRALSARMDKLSEERVAQIIAKDEEITFLNAQVADVQTRLDAERCMHDEYRDRYNEFGVRLERMTAARDKALEALKQAIDEVENLRARMKDGYNWTDDHSGYDRARLWLKDKARPLIAELEEAK